MARFTYLMGSKFGMVQLCASIVHIFSSEKLHHACTVVVHIRETDVASLSHVVLQILPTSRRW